MALFWFLLALVLLAAALALLWLDARKRGDGEPPVTAAQERLAADRRGGDGEGHESGGEGTEPDAAAAVGAKPAPTEAGTLTSGPREVGPTGEVPAEDPPAEAVPLDPAEPTAESSPRLLDKVRAILRSEERRVGQDGRRGGER